MAVPNPLQDYQYYPLTPTSKLLGSSVKWAQILHSQELQLIGSEPTMSPALYQYLSVATLHATRPWLKKTAQLSEDGGRILTTLSSSCPDPLFTQTQGTTHKRKWRENAISPRSLVILPWLANSPKQPIRPQQWGLSSITLIPVTLPLRRVWGNWNIRKYLLD